MKQNQNFTVSVAPMMDWTDRHCRWFHRQLSRHVLLYTEMVVSDAIIHGERDYLLGFHPDEHPVALQIGGSDPVKLAKAARIGADFGYDEINLNVGCPSDRVQAGRFGACLMQEPELVLECFRAMQAAVSVPVTVKCRLGVDDQRVEETLPQFLSTVSESLSSEGCSHFIIHARKAWLKGLSPKENRDVPPLDYDLVREMKVKFPGLEIVLNGGLKTLDAAIDAAGISKQNPQAQTLDGVMLGRAAYHNPWILTDIDSRFYQGEPFRKSREDIALDLIHYAESVQEKERSTKAIIRHIMGLYAGRAGARLWRRSLSENSALGLKPSKSIQLSLETITAFSEAV